MTVIWPLKNANYKIYKLWTMQRTCKTPIGHLKDLMTRNGLKMTEIGTNHLRIFRKGKKLFEYYPVSMKLFDYKEWHQLIYPTPFNDMGTWATEIQGITDSLRSRQEARS